MPAGVTLMDGGTQGLYLLHHIEACEALIVFDAVDYGLAPGEMRLVGDDEVPAFLGVKKMSLHQTGFQEVIATARLKGWEPRRMLLIGVQPEELAWWPPFGSKFHYIINSAAEQPDNGFRYLATG